MYILYDTILYIIPEYTEPLENKFVVRLIGEYCELI